MKNVTNVTFVTIVTMVLILTGCGGGGHKHGGGGGGGAAPLDPTGNWEMIVTDGTNSAQFGALFNQVGAVVTANSFTATGNQGAFNCVPFTASLANGTVAGSNFTGNVTMHYAVNFPSDMTPTQSTWSFNAAIAPDEQSFAGTYASLAACTGVSPTGTFTGTAIPTTSGAWTGTIQPCTYDSQTAVCTDFGNSVALTASLTQDDATGNVTGSYSTSGLPELQGGTVAVAAADQDILSGRFWQFTMTDSSPHKYVANGRLDTSGGFDGIVISTTSTAHYHLQMSH